MPLHLKDRSLFLFGIDNAGKTCLFHALKYETTTDTQPTLSFRVENIIWEDIEFQIWDAPGQRNLRTLWSHGFAGAKMLVFVLDLNDINRYEEAKYELDKVLTNEETQGASLIICYHKFDLPESKKYLIQAKKKFNTDLVKNRIVSTFETSVITGEGIEALRHEIARLIIEKRKPTQ